MIRSRTDLHGHYQTYPDGSGIVYRTIDRKIAETRQENVHFADHTVGERRFWDAQVLGVKIVRAVLVPYSTKVDADDLFVINGTQYEVKQKQRYDKTAPVSWLLSLSEAKIRYRSDLDGGQN